MSRIDTECGAATKGAVEWLRSDASELCFSLVLRGIYQVTGSCRYCILSRDGGGQYSGCGIMMQGNLLYCLLLAYWRFEVLLRHCYLLGL